MSIRSPIYLTRNLTHAKKWLQHQAKGTERIGIICSSGAQRLKANGINANTKIDEPNWFLNDKTDVRSSYYLEDPATEFSIQGLEIDWTCVAWDGNLHIQNGQWQYQQFKGSKWQKINNEQNRKYLKNTYRVLLTRARQGMIIYIPEGDPNDATRSKCYYDGTYHYLQEIGIAEI